MGKINKCAMLLEVFEILHMGDAIGNSGRLARERPALQRVKVLKHQDKKKEGASPLTRCSHRKL